MRQRSRGVHEGALGPLERETDVNKRAYGLHTIVVLGVVEEIPLAALVGGMPFEDIKVWFGRGVWNGRGTS